ncbi:TIGR04283 family arsenosugar biosynthesis glycosyltransferase [Siansivirga zeaxanthinifaciens]|uniref:Glycosyl transferase family 2 n=1 Tax=Siansivirga zeaxanthinifaciens CC-SAMT-1 TaxID=1454006 RepID=A0A0C5WIL4_9FLAO|nr:TIGR04283 family arsenosugar biosynthesis glycosyltransferase [Siansivirga zeaxanthinifaciens]AJR02540.1 glycosyl transferase family 2 [Siansivirga zeaxanthinifaciens CC-SAMT-1]
MNKISIIIPILNEAEGIETLLNYIICNTSMHIQSEIIVVDGGSTDGSQNIVKQYKEVALIGSEKGRAKQMNVGAKHATGNILYFLHADSFPPKNFDKLIIKNIKTGNVAGCFRMEFNSTHWWLKFCGWFTQFNWRICRGGDQSLFITKKLFNSVGGYNEHYIICEDSVLINELYKRKCFTVINSKLKTSARLYEKIGVWKLQYHFLVIHFKKWLGENPISLHSYYKKHIC